MLDHIAILVSSMEALSFYESLGFEAVRRIKRTNDEIVIMKGHDCTLEIFVDAKHPKRDCGPEPYGLRHICFSVDEFDKFAAGFEIKKDFDGNRIVFVKDPDGLPIELKEKKVL